MGACTGKNNSFITEIINENPFILNMTFGETVKVAGKPVFPAIVGQWILPNNFYKNTK
jgi:hypothetical protein